MKSVLLESTERFTKITVSNIYQQLQNLSNEHTQYLPEIDQVITALEQLQTQGKKRG